MKLTWDEIHVFLLGFFSIVTGQQFWKDTLGLRAMIECEGWYYGAGRYTSIIVILSIVYLMIRSIV